MKTVRFFYIVFSLKLIIFSDPLVIEKAVLIIDMIYALFIEMAKLIPEFATLPDDIQLALAKGLKCF